MALSTYNLFNLRSGMNDRSDGLEVPPTYQKVLRNMYNDRSSIFSRKGYVKRDMTAALESGAAIQAVHQYRDNDQDAVIIVACNGKLFRDDMDGNGPATDITGTLAGGLSTSQDARFDFADYDGRCYGTDGVNPPFYIPDQSSNAVLVSSLGNIKKMPSRAGTLANYGEHFFYGDITDFDRAASNRPYRTMHSDYDDIATWSADLGARNDVNRTRKVLALREHDDVLLLFLNRGIWYAMFDPVSGPGQARSRFVYRMLHPRIGLAGARSAVSTPRGTFFLGREGPYWIPPGYPPQHPQYIGYPIENWWADVNKNRLLYSIGAEIPELNGVAFAVPHGSGQTNNNSIIFLNYTSWTAWEEERGEAMGQAIHPAFAVWDNADEDIQPLAFNSLEMIEDTDGRDRLIGGGYNGFVYTLDEGDDDDGQSFTPEFEFPYFGNPGRETHWHETILHADLEEIKRLTGTQTNYDRPYSIITDITAGGEYVLLDDFMLDDDYLAGDVGGPIRHELFGNSLFAKLHFTLATGQSFGLHGATVLKEDGDII